MIYDLIPPIKVDHRYETLQSHFQTGASASLSSKFACMYWVSLMIYHRVPFAGTFSRAPPDLNNG